MPHDDDSLRLLGAWDNCASLAVHPFAPHGHDSAVCPEPLDQAATVTVRALHEVAGDRSNDLFESPGGASPKQSATDVVATLPTNVLGPAVDAVLANWTDLNSHTPPRLVWIVRDMFVAGAPSGPALPSGSDVAAGGAVCGERSFLVDATTGTVLRQSDGATVLPHTLSAIPNWVLPMAALRLGQGYFEA